MKITKKFLVVLLVTATILSLSACGGNGGSSVDIPSAAPTNSPSSADGQKAAPIRLQFNHTVAETTLLHPYCELFAERIEERTGGRYVVDVFGNSQLSAGNQAKGLEMLRAGTIDLDVHSSTIWAGLDERFSIALMPWILPTSKEVEDISGAGPRGEAFLQLVSDNGCVPIATLANGYRDLLNIKRPIKSPEDMKDLKIRVPGMTMFVDLYRTLGCDPTTMNWNEVYSGLQQKTIDGMEVNAELMSAQRFYEVTNYLTVWGACYDAQIFAMSQNLYDRLSEEDRKIFMDTGKETMNEQIVAQLAANEQAIKDMEGDVEVYRLNEEELKVFKQAIKPLYEQYRETFPEDLRNVFEYDTIIG